MKELVHVPVGIEAVHGRLIVPDHARGIVIVVDGIGGPFSADGTTLAHALEDAGLGVLLVDLSSGDEKAHGNVHVPVPQLAERLISVTYWLKTHPVAAHVPVGFLGVRTGAAVALGAAVGLGPAIAAVVAGGGRPDMAVHLERVTAPTLLVVGALESGFIVLHELAFEALTCEKALSVLPGASAVLEEAPGFGAFAARSVEWFTDHLGIASGDRVWMSC